MVQLQGHPEELRLYTQPTNGPPPTNVPAPPPPVVQNPPSTPTPYPPPPHDKHGHPNRGPCSSHGTPMASNFLDDEIYELAAV